MGILIIYVLLTYPTIDKYGIAYDEQTDLDIANSYLTYRYGWFYGSEVDPANARLPMYIGAIVFSFTRNNKLYVARTLTLILGIFTIVGVYILGKTLFSKKHGILASFILATSPYFISFSRIAFTESDMFVTCLLILSLICFTYLWRSGSISWLIVSSIMFGLTLSAKISAISIIPGLLMINITKKRDAQIYKNNSHSTYIALLILSFCFVLVFWYITSNVIFYSHNLAYVVFAYVVCFTIYILTLLSLFNIHGKRYNPLFGIIATFTISFMTFLLIPPVHFGNAKIVKYLINRSLPWFFHGSLFFIPEAFMLHVGSVLFKSSLLIGIFLWLSLIYALFNYKKKEMRLLLIVFLSYFLFLIKIPWAQTFFMMPLLPILSLFASDFFISITRLSRKFIFIFSLLALSILIRDHILVYPDYNLNGLQYIGTRYLWGKSTLGYQSIAQVTTDGIQQTIEWLNQNVGKGKIVVTYISARHIVGAYYPNPKFVLIDGLKRNPDVIVTADYVVTNINDDIRQGFGIDNPTGEIYKYIYNRKYLEENFAKAFRVKRNFNLEVATVWKNKR